MRLCNVFLFYLSIAPLLRIITLAPLLLERWLWIPFLEAAVFTSLRGPKVWRSPANGRGGGGH